MLRQVEIFRDLADGTECVGALVHGRILTLDGETAKAPNRPLISAIYAAIFKPGMMAGLVINR